MWVHFFHRYVRDIVVILKEEKLPHSRCPCCNMLLNWHDMNRRHLSNTQCSRGAESKQRCPSEEELRESLERAFQAYGEPLENVTSFKYLGRVLTLGNDN